MMKPSMDETRDQIAVLLRQEAQHYTCADYIGTSETEAAKTNTDASHVLHELAFTSPTPKVSTVIKSPSLVCVQEMGKQSTTAFSSQPQQPNRALFGFWRQQMFDWACMVVDSFSMDREVVASAFGCLDRYVAHEVSTSSTAISREDFQLFAMTCLYISVKISCPYPRKLGVEALVEMSRGFYSETDIVETERDILTALKWHVHPPTALSFSRLYWGLLLPDEEPNFDEQMSCTTMTEIAIADASFVATPLSLVGLAAVLHSARLSGRCKDPTSALANVKGLVEVENNPDFERVYRQLETSYCS